MRAGVLLCAVIAAALVGNLARGAGIPASDMAEVVITGERVELQGTPVSASEGVITEAQLVLRPVLRTGELLEAVPGLVVTQHSGDGKANQYFLRGFNLDHGTDLATSLDGVPINMPTHAHGQGYTDINFVIPELLQSIDYRKGTYYAEAGNFSAAGAVNMRYRSRLDRSFATLEAGEQGYRRALLALDSVSPIGDLLFGVEYANNDGPWRVPEDFRKVNAVAKVSHEDASSRWSIVAQGYDGQWRATDQVPLRAVESGVVDRFGAVDPTDGGDSSRYSLSGDWSWRYGPDRYRVSLYAIDYRLNLFSNFTYAIDAVHGDQFEQLDQRRIYGGESQFARDFVLFDIEHEFNSGLQWRRDDIEKVGLYATTARARYRTIREDAVIQNSVAGYLSLDSKVTRSLRVVAGARFDYFDFDVRSDTPVNSGRAHESLVSPKLSVVLGPWRETELFANVGRGFHSNDARGATISVDPATQAPADRVDPLVRALGYDVGMRSAAISHLQWSLALYRLDLDSELVFAGDAGATEASLATSRRGIEFGVVFAPIDWLVIDGDAALSHARFDNGDRIPNAVENVVSLGVALNHPSGWRGGIRFRHFGSAPLIEDNSVRSQSTTVFNVEAGYASSDWSATVGVYNVANSEDNDITYYYESQLRGEAAPVADIHFHPVEPRTIRASFSYKF